MNRATVLQPSRRDGISEEQRQAQIEAIADLYGIPPEMMGTATFAGELPLDSGSGVDPRTLNPTMSRCRDCSFGSVAACPWCVRPRCEECQTPLDPKDGWCSWCDAYVWQNGVMPDELPDEPPGEE